MTNKLYYFTPCALVLALLLLISPDAYGVDGQYHIVINYSHDNNSLNAAIDKWQQELESQTSTQSADINYGYYRFEQDKVFLEKSLASLGYYQSNVDGRYDEAVNTSYFTIQSGPQYHFGSIQIVVSSDSTEIDLIEKNALSAKSENPALAEAVLKDEAQIDQWVETNNCLFEHRTYHEAKINHLQRQVDITYRVVTGKKAVFGDIYFQGNETISDLYLQRRAGVKPGECFKRSKLNDAKLALQNSGLVADVDPVLPKEPLVNGAVPITFMIKERPHRTVAAGISYSTDIGPGINAGWEHRNFFSGGEKLSVDLSLATLEQRLETMLEKPFFLRDDQRLKLTGILRHEDADAFRASGLTLSANIERDMGNKWLAGVGVTYALEQIKDQDNTDNIALLSFPLFASQDKRDNLLDPKKGWTISVKTAPAFDTVDVNTAFLKNSINGSYYHALDTVAKPVLAVRAATGSILGASSATIPATERFYTGGGGSIRGYGYQLVGPLDAQNDPLGGRSFVELSTELRMRVLEDYGVVLFIDGGNAFDATYPDFDGGLLWGAGLGFRYYTSFGPIRADIAVPLDKREGVDDSFQIYFSIGQAF